MMYQDRTATRQFATDDGICVFTADGDRDTLMFYEPAAGKVTAHIWMYNPLDLRDYR